MSIEPASMLLVWTDADPAAEDDFNTWYDQEHVPERVGAPGFLSGRRYRALRGNPRYFAAYHTENIQVLFSEAYLALLNNPTSWTKRVMPTFRNTVRSVCSIVRAAGQSYNEPQQALLTLRFNPAPGREAELREGVAGLVEPASGVARISFCEAALGDQDKGGAAASDQKNSETAVSGQGTSETALRGPDEVAGFALLLEGPQAAPLEAAAQAQFHPELLATMGAEGEVLQGCYDLLLAMHA